MGYLVSEHAFGGGSEDGAEPTCSLVSSAEGWGGGAGSGARESEGRTHGERYCTVPVLAKEAWQAMGNLVVLR